jgi:hypothetical protein
VRPILYTATQDTTGAWRGISKKTLPIRLINAITSNIV